MTEYQFITYSADNMIEDIRAFDSAQKLYKYVRKFPLVGNAVRAELWVMEGRDLQKKFILDWDVPKRCRIPRWCVGKVDLLKFLESMDSEPKSPEPEKPASNPHPDKQAQCDEPGCTCFVAPIPPSVKNRWQSVGQNPITYCRRHGGTGRVFKELKSAERELRKLERQDQKSAAALNPNPRALFDASGRIKKNQGLNRVKNQAREAWIRKMEKRGWNMKDRVLLKDWTLTMHPADAHDRYLAPECRRTCLGGKTQNHPDPNVNSTTENLCTSPIKRVEGRLVETTSGTVYELDGHPNKFFMDEVLKKHAAKYNYREPLYFMD